MNLKSTTLSPGHGRFLATLLAGLVTGHSVTAQSVVTSRENYFPREAISLSFSGGPGNPKDWIGIYPDGVTPGSSGSTLWNYVNGTQTAGAGLREGSMTFGSGLNLAGVWTAHLLVNDGYTVVTNVSFNVIEPTAPAVRPSANRFAPGEAITVGFTNGPANPKDWVGIYKAGQTPGSVDSTLWLYVDGTRSGTKGQASGSVSFASGLTTAGDYRVFLLENDGYTVLASEPITVGTSQAATGPSVVSSSPAEGATGVAPNAPYRASLTNGFALASIRLWLNGQAVTPTVTGTAQHAEVTFTNAVLLAPASSNVYVLSFSGTGVPARTLSLTNAFQVADYRNLELPTPLVFENFDAIPEGQVPTGWTRKSYVEIANPELDFGNLGSAAYAEWTTVDAARFNGSFITYNNPDNPPDWGTDYQRVNVPNPERADPERAARQGPLPLQHLGILDRPQPGDARHDARLQPLGPHQRAGGLQEPLGAEPGQHRGRGILRRWGIQLAPGGVFHRPGRPGPGGGRIPGRRGDPQQGTRRCGQLHGRRRKPGRRHLRGLHRCPDHRQPRTVHPGPRE